MRDLVASKGAHVDVAFRPVERPRVLERLREAAQYRVTAIIAPAGFGKSTALRQFLQHERSAVRYDVPSDATSLSRFVRGLVHALARVVPDAQRSLATALEGAEAAAEPGTHLADWLALHMPSRRLIIAIDDLHLTDEAPAVSSFIRRVVDKTSREIRWIFASRTTTRLPLATWTAYGVAGLPLTERDLRVLLPEALAIASHVGSTLTQREVTELLHLVGGWVTGFQCALVVGQRDAALSTITADSRDLIYAYLAEQVWDMLDPDTRRFLRIVAFLPIITAKICTAAGFDTALDLLEGTREQGAFLVKVDDESYALHDLFRDFVRQNVKRDGEEAVRFSWLRAGLALEANALFPEALSCYLEAGARERTAELLARQGVTLARLGHFDLRAEIFAC